MDRCDCDSSFQRPDSSLKDMSAGLEVLLWASLCIQEQQPAADLQGRSCRHSRVKTGNPNVQFQILDYLWRSVPDLFDCMHRLELKVAEVGMKWRDSNKPYVKSAHRIQHYRPVKWHARKLVQYAFKISKTIERQDAHIAYSGSHQTKIQIASTIHTLDSDSTRIQIVCASNHGHFSNQARLKR